MFVSRLTHSLRAVTLGAVALTLAALSGIVAPTAAHADAVPFWEQSDIDAKKAKSRSDEATATRAERLPPNSIRWLNASVVSVLRNP